MVSQSSATFPARGPQHLVSLQKTGREACSLDYVPLSSSQRISTSKAGDLAKTGKNSYLSSDSWENGAHFHLRENSLQASDSVLSLSLMWLHQFSLVILHVSS